MTRYYRHLLFTLGSIAVAYAICELFTLAISTAVWPGTLSPRRLQEARASVSEAPPLQRPGRPGIIPEHKRDPGARSAEVLHPYVGFVWDPTVMPHKNEFGFPLAPPPLGETRPDQLIVGIFGGSFGHGVAACGARILEQELPLLKQFRDKKVRVFDFCVDGYKQPQQLFTLTYFMAMGVHFDIVINIDGFNEVTIPPTELLPKRVFPLFPRGWFTRVQGQGFDQESIAQLGEIAMLHRWRVLWARFFSALPLRLSPFLNVVWLVGDHGLSALRRHLVSRFEQHETDEKSGVSYLATGPRVQLGDPSDPYPVLADIWARCSLQMHKICHVNGALYFHFLQPNQYFPGSKPLSRSERRYAFREDSPVKVPVERGYPLLRMKGQELTGESVWFTDLSMLFSDREQTLYRDNCCHCNSDGYVIVTKRILQEIAQRTCE